MKHKIKTFSILTLATLVTIHLINKILFGLSTVKGLLIKSENQYYEWRFGKIRYTKKGSGNPILLLHNLTCGSSIYEFHKIIDDLSKTNEVYALDLLGYGLSDKPNLTYTNFLFVEMINDFIKNIIGKKTDIITSGDTSSIAIMACHNNPEIINRMLFINPQSLYEINQIPSKQSKLLKFLIETPIIGTFIYNIISQKSSIKNSFTSSYFYDPTLIDDNDITHYLESAHTQGYQSKYSFASYISKYTNINILHALKEINYSMYIIGGKEIDTIDTIIDNYTYYNSSIESTVVKRTKQLPHLESPHDTLVQIHTFLN